MAPAQFPAPQALRSCPSGAQPEDVASKEEDSSRRCSKQSRKDASIDALVSVRRGAPVAEERAGLSWADAADDLVEPLSDKPSTKSKGR